MSVDMSSGRPVISVTVEAVEASNQIKQIAGLAKFLVTDEMVTNLLDQCRLAETTLPLFDPTGYLHGGGALLERNIKLVLAFSEFRKAVIEFFEIPE